MKTFLSELAYALTALVIVFLAATACIVPCAYIGHWITEDFAGGFLGFVVGAALMNIPLYFFVDALDRKLAQIFRGDS